ncbi:hypothetical protein BJX76DRAFT_353044 [Aspergillus varians]
MDLRTKAIKGIAVGIGLASESVSAYKANRKEKKEKEQQEKENGGETDPATSGPRADEDYETAAADDNDNDHDHDHLEEEWELDEAQDELHREQGHDGKNNNNNVDVNVNVDQLTASFLHDHPLPPSPTPTTSSSPKLPYPVILPQRRPKTNKRGFIRAYAPILESFGIDQPTFLSFLETSNRACQATPWLYALNLASIGTIWIPGVISFVVSAVIQIGTEAAIAVEGRRKTNTFFDKINAEFFRPRGLFCLVMTWDAESSSTFSRFDLNTAVSTAVEHGGPGTMNKLRHKFKSSDGKTHGELPFPECAPLIFPDLDALAAAGDGSKSKVKRLKRKDFVADYFDRRERAAFTVENPDSALNMAPAPTFTSRYADPSHPAASGDLLGLVSGGRVTAESLPRRRPASGSGDGVWDRRRGGRGGGILGGGIGPRGFPRRGIISAVASRRGAPQDAYADAEYDYGRGRIPGVRGGGRTRGGPLSGGLIGGAQKLLKGNVLYLMIVNMPSEEEMAAARAIYQD